MSWILLSDDYANHPKFTVLSDGAFRLWHQALGWCRTYHTDGLVPLASLRDLKAFSPKRMRELLTPWRVGEQPLWHDVIGFGVRFHDYLDIYASKEEDSERRADSRDRMRRLRLQRRAAKGLPPAPLVRELPPAQSDNGVCANISQTPCERSPDVLERSGSSAFTEKESEGKPDRETEFYRRAGELREKWYPAWYSKYRHGAKLRLVASTLEFEDSLSIVRNWDDRTIEKLAVIVLTTDDDWISHTDRSFRIFALKASWAHDRLCQEEAMS